MVDYEKEPLLKCVKIIITKCLQKNTDLIQDTALCFEDNKAISKKQRKKILDDAKAGFLKEAAESLTDSLYRRDPNLWKANLVISVGDKDFPGDKRMSRLLVRLLAPEPLPLEIKSLIFSWNHILASQEQLNQLWNRIWPGDGSSSFEDDWVLDLILKCHLEKDKSEGKEFISSVLDLVACEKKKAEKEGEKVKQSCTEVVLPILLEDGEVLECAKKVMLNYVSSDAEYIENFALAFCDSGLISKARRNEIRSDIKKELVDNARSKLVLEWSEDTWKKGLLEATSEEDFPGDETLLKLLKHLALGKPVARSTSLLIHSWPKWKNAHQDVQQLFKLVWPQEKEIPVSDGNWPTLIILKCLNASDLEKVSQFADRVLALAQEKDLSEQEGSGDARTSPKKLRLDKENEGDKLGSLNKVVHVKNGSLGASSGKGKPSTKKDPKSELKALPPAKDADELKSLHSSDTSEEIEFRVVLAKGSTIVAGHSICVYINLYGDWTSVKLNKLERFQYYSCILPILKPKRSFQYKYYMETTRPHYLIWEKFPSDGGVLSNRIIRSADLEQQSIFHDVASFEEKYSSKSWRVLVQESITKHVVYADSIILHCEQDGERVCNFAKEIFAWMHSIKKTYEITGGYYGRVLLSLEAMQGFFVEWLQHNHSKLLTTGKKHDVLRLILSTLTLVAAMHQEGVIISKERLLREIFLTLSMHKLTEDEQRLLYEEITKESEMRLDFIQDAIISLFRVLKSIPVVEFLLALPLYWLVANKGVNEKKIMKPGPGNLVLQRSAMPSASQLKWSDIKSRFMFSSLQQDLIELSNNIYEIYKVSPWIVGSYQYMLSEQSLIIIIEDREKNKIGENFPLGVVLHHLLHACKRRDGEVKISDLDRLSDYFVCTFQSMIANADKNAMDGDKELTEADKNLDVPENVLQSMAALIAEIVKNCYDFNQTEMTNNNMLWCLNITSHASQLAYALSSGDTQTDIQEIKKSLVDIQTSVTTRIHKCKVDDEQLKYWNALMIMNWTDEKFDAKWKEVMRNEMKQKIQNAWRHKDEEFLNYYAVKLDSVNLEEAVEACFSEKAFQCTEALLAEYGSTEARQGHGLVSQAKSVYRNVMSRFSTPRFIRIFEKLFTRELQKAANSAQGVLTFDMEALTFLFSWNFVSQFYRLFNTKDALAKFSSKTSERISDVAAAFHSIVASLKSGDVLVKQLKLIEQNRERFLELHDTIIKKPDSSVDKTTKYLSHIIDHRMEQLSAYQTAADHMRAFLSACSKLDEGGEVMVNTTELKDKLRESANADDEMLSKIFPESMDIASVSQQTSFFQLSPVILQRFKDIASIKDSKVFHEIWYQSAMDAKSQSADSGYDLGDRGLWRVTWKNVVDKVWKGTHNDMMELVQKMDAGTLTLDHASEYFQRCSGEPEEIKREIDALYNYYHLVIAEKEKPKNLVGAPATTGELGTKNQEQVDDSDESEESDKEDDDSYALSEEASEYDDSDEDESSGSGDEDYEPVRNIKLRTRQLSCYFQLEKAKETIDLLLMMRDDLHLTGSFNAIESQKNSVEDKLMTLADLPDDQEIPFVCGISQTDVDCLRTFIKERELIHWLKERMNDVSEVQVMCDLAMISAGETPFELDIVSCLLSAVMGFAPLIFELEPTAGLNELLAKCKAVWKNRDGDGKLMEKWKDTGQQLAWFKGIENFHGSVEKQSLMLAQEINERGIYYIERKGPMGGLNMKDCIRLSLPNKNEIGKSDTYHLNALCDLQSKLMLIAGEAEMGQTDVANFVEVLNSIQILATTFVKLVSAGCMLFKDWSAVITCDNVTTKTSNNLVIRVKFGENSHALSGTCSLPDLGKLSTILNQSLERWNNYIASKRSKHYFLNEYNVQQMTYLCHQLAVFKDTVPDQVHTLLLCVAEYANVERLHDLLNEATKIQDDEKPAESDSDVEMKDEGKTAKEVDVVEAKNRAVRHLMDKEDMDEDIAKAAVQAEGFEDSDNCLNWCLLNTYEEEKVKSLCAQFNEDAGFSHREKEIRVITSMLHSRSQSTLSEVVKRLQQEASRSDDNTLMDYVNTICIGYHDETQVITLQDSLSVEHLGRFLFLLHGDAKKRPIVRELMQPLEKGRPNLLVCQEQEILPSVLRLYMFDEDQPLPSASEVLVCSEKTTANEIERFMRRAICKCDSKDQLIFALAFADKLSFKVSTATEKIYNQLSQESRNDEYQLVILLNNQQHYLATCFDKYLIEGKWITAGIDIPRYVEKHLKVTGANLATSTACVDTKNSMVRVVSSTRSGVGKSLHVQRLTKQVRDIFRRSSISWRATTIRLLEHSLDLDYVIERLYRFFAKTSKNSDPMLIHIDLTPAVQKGINAFAFNLFVLGRIQDSSGRVWRRDPNHLYMLEMTDCGRQGKVRFSPRHILNLLPSVKCLAPKEVLEKCTGNRDYEWLGMDQDEFRSAVFQRPYQYLMMYDRAQQHWSMLDSFSYRAPAGTPDECIRTLLHHCCMSNPSWAQLRHFASFLNVQLENCENSVYCDQSIVGQELAGLKAFAVRFMIRMSQDFATPSLNISDESSADYDDEDGGEEATEDLRIYQFRRKWEESTHPYLFFNEDRTTMTFINVNISDEGDLLDKNGDIIEPGIISKQLVAGLKLQRVSLDLNFDTFSRKQKLRILHQVMGVESDFDPDPTYELTTDNVLKILAIYMRFRCRIPVIIMGETGCGKTRMVEFLSKLKSGGTADSMITLKIHGGITVANIYDSVRKAQEIAHQNATNYRFDTILFYDEANTTEAIYAIKEVMCDLTIDGNSFKESQLKLVAACNPYKQLSKDAIKKLEDSGLGYRIKTSDTAHLFGNVPMRTLVYRVVALPPSMQPFVWDFGQLSDEAERIYIQQMTKKLGQNLELERETLRLINAILTEAQNYMKSRRDECRYVSLRDVERCVITYQWFYERKETMYPLIEKEIEHRYQRMNRDTPETDDALRTLLQTIGICYHASLDDRLKFREKISYAFGLEGMHVGELQIREEISAAQSVFLRNVKMDDNIAANEALQENVFMMTVCADMRIPLFLIGKPGSSKSLAKTIVGDNMQGNTSRSSLYKKLKQVHILSYQCSALTDAAGIESVFKQCAQLQANQDLQSYTAVVVLDEIGLAEDSANMPLKVLHPLLECGSTNNTSLTEFDVKKKVGFVGISNWALDPAKMNRGIFVTRNKPSKDDLKKTAKGIFENHKSKINENSELLEKLTESYMRVYEGQDVEYFGLRDYYSLIKMVHNICTATKDATLTFEDVANAIHRNFSGGKSSHFETFRSNIQHLYRDMLMSSVPIRKMISDNLRQKESRFLLLLTNQFSASSLLQLCLVDFDSGVQVIFGSSFPGDHNYTDICRNINRIKVCMETGRTVVLLNMTEIHESLYDALNQHYVTFGGQRYVDLGLGGHRVKCRIADDFRLIVIEQKEVVYDEYPIPLINRLEKHHLDSRSLLSPEQRILANGLTNWTKKFTDIRGKDFIGKDAFIGYHDDTVCSVVLMTGTKDENVHREVLLQSAAMDAVFRLPESDIGGETDSVQEMYLKYQVHDSLLELLKKALESDDGVPLLEVTSFSNILSETDRRQIESELGLSNAVMLLSLEQFETEQEYVNKLDEFFRYCEREEKETDEPTRILLIQCSQAQTRGQLLACAKHCLNNKLKGFHAASRKATARKAIVALLLSTEREGETQHARGTLLLQHAQDNRIVYVDELRPTNKDIAPASHFYKKSLCDILKMGAEELETGKSDRSLVNVLALLRDCICEAVAKVKSRLRQSSRYFERVKILSNLFANDHDAAGPTTGFHFRKILFEKMIALYSESGEENTHFWENDWIVGEACNRDSLQEGGTFRKTLWLCLKRHFSRLIAFIISITDKQNNLDLLVQGGNDNKAAWKINMWLEYFQSMQLSWSMIGRGQEFLMTSPPQHKTTVPCIVPFSFDLHELFISRWDTLTQQNTPNVRQIFFTLCRQSPLFQIIAKAIRPAKVARLMGFYAEDLVNCLYISGSGKPQEFESVKEIVYEIAMKMLLVWRNDPQFTSGDEITVVFVAYKEQSVYLNLMSEMFRAYPELLEKVNNWIEMWRRDDEQFLIHISAFESLLEILEEKADGLNNPQVCLEWKTLMAVAKRIFKKLINRIDSPRAKDKIMKRWMPLTLVYLMIEHLLPSENPRDVFDRYVSVISPNVKLLWRGCVTGKDVRSHQTLKITCNVLRRVYDDIMLKHLINWGDFSCRMCRKRVEEPTFFPCGHFICQRCVGVLITAADVGSRCPTCAARIEDNFQPLPATLNTAQAKQVATFQSNCTSLFLEYLRQFCFSSMGDTEAANMDVQVKSLLSELVVEAPTERKEYQCKAIDNNITTKACILRILLNNFPDLTKSELNGWFAKLNRKLIENLTVVVIKCFEDQVLLDVTALLTDRMKCLDHWEKMLGAAWRNILVRRDEMTKVELLKNLAEIRCCIAEASRCVDDIFKRRDLQYDVTAKADSFVTFAVQICNDDNAGPVMKEYVVKMACHTYGTDWFHQLRGNAVLENLIPISLLEASEENKMDLWPLLGGAYTDQKSVMYKSPITDLAKLMGTLLRQDPPRNRLGRILALMTWVHNKEDDVKVEVADLLQKHQDAGTYFFKYLIHLHAEFIPALKATQILTEQQEFTLYQLVTTVVAMVTSRSHMMDGFVHALTRPSVVANMFLPGMPESPFFSVPADMRRHGYNMLYTCPNGHLYAIGECLRPMEVAKCADCGAAIGGTNHQSLAGNRTFALQNEQTQAGYLLNKQGNNVIDAADRMSKQGAAVVQFLLHTCLLLGLDNEQAAVLGMIGHATKQGAQKYLVQQLLDSLQALSDALARNMDEAILVMYEIILRLFNQRQGTLPPDWSTLEKRRQWEEMFRDTYLVPVFQNLDVVIRDSQERINSAEDQCSMALYRLVHEIKPVRPTNKTDFEWTDPMLWQYIKHASSAHLLQYIGDHPDIQEGVLKIILESPDLNLVKYLEPVLQLQSILIEKYQNETDMNDAERIKFKDFEKDGGHSHRGLMDQYIIIWNKVFRKLKAKLSYEKRLRGFFMPIDIQSPISMGLPSTRGRGQCAKLLAEHLIDLQNDFLAKCKQVMKSDESIEEAEIPQLFHPHFVCVNKQEDLLPLIHMHTRYSIVVDKQGKHHQISYNMDALEKQAREKFAMYKKLIVKSTLPTIQYPQDIGIGSDWDKVLSNIPQLPLSAKIAQDVDGIVLRVTSADVCEGVRTLTHAISFLAKVKSNAKRFLYEFLEKDLLLSPSRLSVIPKSVQMEHTLSLYGRLSWHKAAHFALRGLNPYKDALATVEQSKITKREVLTELKEFFEHSDVVLLQQRLNEMLIKIPDFNADWSLTDIFPYFEFIGDDGNDDSWYERLPEEIHFKHVSDLFSRAVNFTNQRP